MSRYVGKNNVARPILKAAEHWKTAALISDGAIFQDKEIWKIDNFQELDQHLIKQRGFNMRPDISFVDRKNQIVMIADAKWKILDEGEKNLGISQADMYQIGSYASRYQVKSLVLVYPMQEKLTKPVYINLEETEATLLVQPIDIFERKSYSPARARAILSFLSSSSLSEASAS